MKQARTHGGRCLGGCGLTAPISREAAAIPEVVCAPAVHTEALQDETVMAPVPLDAPIFTFSKVTSVPAITSFSFSLKGPPFTEPFLSPLCLGSCSLHFFPR